MKYKTINGWTKASMIEHIKKEFKGKSDTKPYGHCLYRGPGGAKCAIGMFIPNEHYTESMDNGVGAGTLCDTYPELNTYMPLEGPEALAGFQLSHDDSPEEACLDNILAWVDLNVAD